MEKQTTGADAVREVGLSVIANVFLELHPDALVGTNLLAVGTDREDAAEGLDFFEGAQEVAVRTFEPGDRNLTMMLDTGDQKAECTEDEDAQDSANREIERGRGPIKKPTEHHDGEQGCCESWDDACEASGNDDRSNEEELPTVRDYSGYGKCEESGNTNAADHKKSSTQL